MLCILLPSWKNYSKTSSHPFSAQLSTLIVRMMFGTGRKRLTETNECLVLESKIPFLWLDKIYSESIQLMSIRPNGWNCLDEHGKGRNPMNPNMFKRSVILLHVFLRFRWGCCFFLLKLYPTATRSQGLLPPSVTSWREKPSPSLGSTWIDQKLWISRIRFSMTLLRGGSSI